MEPKAVTRAPAMTPAERQANRQARIREDVQRGREARHQVNSLNTLLTHMAARDLRLEIDPATLPLEQPINAMMEMLMRQVREAEAARLQTAASDAESPYRPVSHVDDNGNAVAPTPKPCAKAKPRVTVAPSKGSSKPRRVRERVGK